jgi:NADH-quinone oxidoreductase subunit I
LKQWATDVWEGFYTVLVGMKITWRHLFVKKATLHYPEEKWQLPPKSRMRLFMKYEDCIGCGQCARACPVQCIYIKAEKRDPKAPAIFAANGQGIKLDVSVFDIDMSLCCYCNLCTYPCPTDCIYMTPEYEFATTDLSNHLYHFAKTNAKFLTVNPKPPAPKPAAATGAAAAAGPAAAAATAPAVPAAKPAAAATAAKPAAAATAEKPAAEKPAVDAGPAPAPQPPLETRPTAGTDRDAPGSPPGAPSPGTTPQQKGTPVGAANNPQPNVATGEAGAAPKPEEPKTEEPKP